MKIYYVHSYIYIFITRILYDNRVYLLIMYNIYLNNLIIFLPTNINLKLSIIQK